MSKQIFELIKALPQAERIDLHKKLGSLHSVDAHNASLGVDPGVNYWDDFIAKEYPEAKEESAPVVEIPAESADGGETKPDTEE